MPWALTGGRSEKWSDSRSSIFEKLTDFDDGLYYGVQKKGRSQRSSYSEDKGAKADNLADA